MRSAALIDQIQPADLRNVRPPAVPDGVEGGGLVYLGEDQGPVAELLRPYLDRVGARDAKPCWWACEYALPHKDEGVVGDVTIGVVFAGDHVLFTGRGRAVGRLVPGSVFVLDNKRLHGARKASEDAPALLFATVDIRGEYGELQKKIDAQALTSNSAVEAD